MEFDQVLSALAVIDEYKLRIVDVKSSYDMIYDTSAPSALEVYTKLLGRDRDECVQQAAAHGLWMLALKNKDRIISEEACIEGW